MGLGLGQVVLRFFFHLRRESVSSYFLTSLWLRLNLVVGLSPLWCFSLYSSRNLTVFCFSSLVSLS